MAVLLVFALCRLSLETQGIVIASASHQSCRWTAPPKRTPADPNAKDLLANLANLDSNIVVASATNGFVQNAY